MTNGGMLFLLFGFLIVLYFMLSRRKKHDSAEDARRRALSVQPARPAALRNQRRDDSVDDGSPVLLTGWDHGNVLSLRPRRVVDHEPAASVRPRDDDPPPRDTDTDTDSGGDD